MASVSATRIGLKARVAGCGLLVLLLLSRGAWAYPEETLQILTFTAAKAFNRCVEGTATPRLSALQVRNLVLGNVAEGEAGVLRRATRWGYYDRAEGEEDRRWLWLVSTRLHDRFEDRAAKVLMQDGVRATLRYEDLGSVLYYLQRVTIPANVIPIFHPRPWRWPSGDRFTDYPIDEVPAVKFSSFAPLTCSEANHFKLPAGRLNVTVNTVSAAAKPLALMASISNKLFAAPVSPKKVYSLLSTSILVAPTTKATW